ncbi:DUF2934 domain-containing protein [Agrobacterium rhizogenes]|nr:DUF2934 domain-containing protein [Rhizobium rhizogenes]NTH62123.1 DUF2934 domain-containing protein [Rhizobium rhizogenes]NTH93749.1 DUF2934 domain-containing protein [Rhizobium rhizogenes]
MDERSEWISKHACSLLEGAERPWGCDQQHWNQAAELTNDLWPAHHAHSQRHDE